MYVNSPPFRFSYHIQNELGTIAFERRSLVEPFLDVAHTHARVPQQQQQWGAAEQRQTPEHSMDYGLFYGYVGFVCDRLST